LIRLHETGHTQLSGIQHGPALRCHLDALLEAGDRLIQRQSPLLQRGDRLL
jgi:hypothetical protein